MDLAPILAIQNKPFSFSKLFRKLNCQIFLRITGRAKQVVIFPFLYKTDFCIPIYSNCSSFQFHRCGPYARRLGSRLSLEELGIPRLIAFWRNNNPNVLSQKQRIGPMYNNVCAGLSNRSITRH